MFRQKLLSYSVNYCTKLGKNANYASNNGMYMKRDKVRIKKIVLDLHDVITDSKKVVVLGFLEKLLLEQNLNTIKP